MKTNIHIGRDFKKPEMMVKMTLITNHDNESKNTREKHTQ